MAPSGIEHTGSLSTGWINEMTTRNVTTCHVKAAGNSQASSCDNHAMIPSSPKRTWLFLLLTMLAFYGPGMLVPETWDKNTTWLLLYSFYQSAVVLIGFWYGPAICHALVVERIVDGPLCQAVDDTLEVLHQGKGQVRLAELPVTLFNYPTPFIVTVGLLPQHSEVFLSSDLVDKLGVNGRRFLLARALVHGNWPQRLASLLPVLALTLLLPGTPTDALAWLELAGFLAGWLVVHWFFELRADRQAAVAMGAGATEGLQEMLAATAPPVAWLSLHPPIRWRLQRVTGE